MGNVKATLFIHYKLDIDQWLICNDPLKTCSDVNFPRRRHR